MKSQSRDTIYLIACLISTRDIILINYFILLHQKQDETRSIYIIATITVEFSTGSYLRIKSPFKKHSNLTSLIAVDSI